MDKCLLVILGLLMLQSALNLFLHEQVNSQTNGIDVVVRTSAASIFGYLVSVNFNQHRKRSSKSQSTQKAASAPARTEGGAGGVTAQIGFRAGEEGDALSAAPPVLTQEERWEEEHRSDRAQILVVAAIGVISLVVLLIFRNFMQRTSNSAGSLTQFRDFVSGSVGFLISCSTSGIHTAEK